MLFASLLRASEHRRVVNVSTVSQLYAAVNNAKNVGVTIHLAPGAYVLSAMSPEGGTRRHGGFSTFAAWYVSRGINGSIRITMVCPIRSRPTTHDFAVPGL
jgi:hypothetical protein